jgi:hypothetical protein
VKDATQITLLALGIVGVVSVVALLLGQTVLAATAVGGLVGVLSIPVVATIKDNGGG